MFFKNLTLLLKNYIFSIILIFVLIAIALRPIDFAFSKPIVLGAISVFFLYSLFVFNRLYIVAVALFTILISFDTYLAYAFSSYMNIGIFASLIETNLSEAKSMLRTIWLPALIVFSVLFSLFLLSARELRRGQIPYKYFCCSFGFILLLIAVIYKFGYDREELNRYTKEYPVLIFHNLVYTYTPLLYGNFATAVAYYDDKKRFDNFKSSSEKSLPKGIKWDGKVASPQKIVMIVGESALRDHMSLYGYSEPTTPFFDSLSQAEPLKLVHYNGISGANITRNALRLLMSFATPHEMDLFFEHKSLLDMAKKAGYQTLWISDQGHSSLDDTYIGYLAAGADTSYYHTATYFASDDLDLLPSIKELIEADRRQFVVLHIVGSHADYKDRYDAVDAQQINSSNKQYRDYDRSIHHTDRFLHEVYKILEEQGDDFLMYYVSDHGEEPGVGHGVRRDNRQFDVPMVFVNHSDLNIDSIVSKYIDNQSRLLSSSNTPYILGELMGYTVKDHVIENVIDKAMYVFHSDHSVEHYQYIPKYKGGY